MPMPVPIPFKKKNPPDFASPRYLTNKTKKPGLGETRRDQAKTKTPLMTDNRR